MFASFMYGAEEGKRVNIGTTYSVTCNEAQKKEYQIASSHVFLVFDFAHYVDCLLGGWL